jgi:hypothetical protein
MRDTFALLQTLDRLFDGDRASILTLDEFLAALRGRSYAFAILALDVPNCIPTGIPWLSTVTGVPMLVLLTQYFTGRPAPSLPGLIGRRGLQRGKLKDFLARIRPQLAWLEAHVHARLDWWVTDLRRQILHLAWSVLIVILALPLPFDNLIPAWAILFFCFALIEDDGAMAIAGWTFTLLTACWTIFLLLIGHAAIFMAIRMLGDRLF